jgi:hypothetical protein
MITVTTIITRLCDNPPKGGNLCPSVFHPFSSVQKITIASNFQHGWFADEKDFHGFIEFPHSLITIITTTCALLTCTCSQMP